MLGQRYWALHFRLSCLPAGQPTLPLCTSVSLPVQWEFIIPTCIFQNWLSVYHKNPLSPWFYEMGVSSSRRWPVCGRHGTACCQTPGPSVCCSVVPKLTMWSKRTVMGSITASGKEKKMCFSLRVLLRTCTHDLSLNPLGQNFIPGPDHLLGKLGNVVSIPPGHSQVNIRGCIMKGEGATGGLSHTIYQSHHEDKGDNTQGNWTAFGGGHINQPVDLPTRHSKKPLKTMVNV